MGNTPSQREAGNRNATGHNALKAERKRLREILFHKEKLETETPQFITLSRKSRREAGNKNDFDREKDCVKIDR